MIFPKLPVLKKLSQRFLNLLELPFENITFVCVQHILETTGSLFEALTRHGAKPENIYIMGKFYSTHAETAERMRKELGLKYYDSKVPIRLGEFHNYFSKDINSLWVQVIRKLKQAHNHSIIVIDEGGMCIRRVPDYVLRNFNVIGLEQTTSGIKNHHQTKFPVIDIASSAIKKHVECLLIIETIIEKLKSHINLKNNSTYGVIGLGNIGRSLAIYLKNKGLRVNIYDIDPVKECPSGVHKCPNVIDLLNSSEIIFGCTGDHLPNESWFSEVTGEKILVSCSSADIEFLEILHRAENPLIERKNNHYLIQTAVYKDLDNKLIYRILNGGFPINFDRTSQSVPSMDIQLTRGLIFAGMIQAAALLETDIKYLPNTIMLDPILQRYTIKTWMQYRKSRLDFHSDLKVKNLTDTDWIKRESGKGINITHFT